MFFKQLLSARHNTRLAPKKISDLIGLRVNCIVYELANTIEHLKVFQSILRKTLEMRFDKLEQW